MIILAQLIAHWGVLKHLGWWLLLIWRMLPLFGKLFPLLYEYHLNRHTIFINVERPLQVFEFVINDSYVRFRLSAANFLALMMVRASRASPANFRRLSIFAGLLIRTISSRLVTRLLDT